MIRNFLILLALAIATPLAAEEPDFDSFGEFLEQFRKDSGTPAMSAVIVKDGEVAWETYLGTSDDERDFPTTAETTYYIASVTKPIAATAILAESLAGGVSLNEPMTSDPAWEEFCTYFRTTPIPFMSGGEDEFGNAIAPVDCDKPTTLAEMLDMRVNGDAFVYNPIAFARIDRVIEGGGGRDLRQIVRERVLAPSGIENAALGWRDPYEGSALRLLAMPHHTIDGRIVKQALSDDDFRASAGMIASPRAIAAFDIALDAGKLIPATNLDRIASMELGPLGDYQNGWFVEDYASKRLIWHSGKDDERYSALYLKIPEDRLTLIVLANTEAIWNEGSSVVAARIDQSPVARHFLENFAQ